MKNKKNILISVVVPVYNVEKYLNRCIDSILIQTYDNIEILLIDDGSTDGSAQICDKYIKKDKRVKVFHKKNGGLSDARNVGIDISNGKYIMFIDSDDSVEKDIIEYLYKLIIKFNTKMSVCSHNIIFNNGEKIKKLGSKKEELLTDKECIKRMLYHKDIDTSAWAKLYSRELFYDIRYPKGFLFEDIGTTYKFFLKSKFIACGYFGKYNYFVRKNSIVTETFSEKKLDLLKMTDMMGNDVLENFPDLNKAVLRRRVYARFSTLNQMIGVDNVDNIRKNLINFIKKNAVKILIDRLVPIRDKIAIILLCMDYKFYELIWKSIK